MFERSKFAGLYSSITIVVRMKFSSGGSLWYFLADTRKYQYDIYATNIYFVAAII
jgi:hypothetical protein